MLPAAHKKAGFRKGAGFFMANDEQSNECYLIADVLIALAARHGSARFARLNRRVEHGVHRVHVEEVREGVATQAQANGFEAYTLLG